MPAILLLLAGQWQIANKEVVAHTCNAHVGQAPSPAHAENFLLSRY